MKLPEDRNERIRLASQTGMSQREIARLFGLSQPSVSIILNPRANAYDPDAARMKRLPEQLDAARRKVRALENEARRRGMLDLIGGGA